MQGLIVVLGRTIGVNKKSFIKVKVNEEEIFRIDQPNPDEKPNKIKKTLWTIIVHLGPFSESGHYITFQKQPNNQHWFLYDDENCRIVDWPYIQKYADSYLILIYI